MNSSNRERDAIVLGGLPLAVLLAALGLTILLLAVRLLPDRPEPPEEKRGALLDVAAEHDQGAREYEVLHVESSPHGEITGGRMSIAVPCNLDRHALTATMREGLIAMYTSHPDHVCHELRVHASELSGCPPIAVGWLCKDGVNRDGLTVRPWDFTIHEVQTPVRRNLGLAVEEDDVKICDAMTELSFCPRADGRPLDEQAKDAAAKWGVSRAEARQRLETYVKMMSANDSYQADLR